MSIEWDIKELAYRAMGETHEGAEKQINGGDIDDALEKYYDIDFETYNKIVKDLIKFTPIISGSLPDKKFHAFVDTERQVAILKLEV